MPTEQVLCWLSAAGVGLRTICELLEIEEHEAKSLLSQSEMAFEVRRAKTRFFGKDPKARFRAMSEKAMEVAETLLGDETQKSGIRLKAAGEIFDRSFGKPEQTVNMEGSLLRRLMERLDSVPEKAAPLVGGAIVLESMDVTPELKIPEKMDPADWVEKNL